MKAVLDPKRDLIGATPETLARIDTIRSLDFLLTFYFVVDTINNR